MYHSTLWRWKRRGVKIRLMCKPSIGEESNESDTYVSRAEDGPKAAYSKGMTSSP